MAGLRASLFAVFGFLLVYVGAAATPPTDANIAGEVINALQLGLVTQINAFITLESLTTNVISVNFEAKNPLIFELTIDRVVSSAGLNGTVYATFDQTFSKPVVVPPLGSANSGTFGNVQLPQGATASLAIIPFGELDLMNTDVFLRAATVDGLLGIPVPITGLMQTDVPANYTLDLD